MTCYNTDGFVPEYFNLNKYENDDIKKFLCATSAIPIAFQNEKIYGKNYIDGGVKDNVPLRPLLQEKCTHALVVNLGDEHEDYSGFDIKTIVLHPSSNLGNLFSGTMDFSLENATKRINIGYSDCKNIYLLKIGTLLEDFMNDEEIELANQINEMNDNKILLETLKKVSMDPTLAGKIQCNMNSEMGTSGGKVFWQNLADFAGWRFQQNNLTKHIRLLDPMNNRKAWAAKQKMVNVCKNFLINELKNECEAKAKYSQKI